jgi:signal transduction histidine kinase
LTVTDEPRPCRPEVEEGLLRIAQEAANNANRHAEGREIDVALEYRGRRSFTPTLLHEGQL